MSLRETEKRESERESIVSGRAAPERKQRILRVNFRQRLHNKPRMYELTWCSRVQGRDEKPKLIRFAGIEDELDVSSSDFLQGVSGLVENDEGSQSEEKVGLRGKGVSEAVVRLKEGWRRRDGRKGGEDEREGRVRFTFGR